MTTMTIAARKSEPPPGPARATCRDVLEAPTHRVAELIEGALHTHPRPAAPHTLASSVLSRRVASAYHDRIGDPGGWWIIDAPALHLGRVAAKFCERLGRSPNMAEITKERLRRTRGKIETDNPGL